MRNRSAARNSVAGDRGFSGESWQHLLRRPVTLPGERTQFRGTRSRRKNNIVRILLRRQSPSTLSEGTSMDPSKTSAISDTRSTQDSRAKPRNPRIAHRIVGFRRWKLGALESSLCEHEIISLSITHIAATRVITLPTKLSVIGGKKNETNPIIITGIRTSVTS